MNNSKSIEFRCIGKALSISLLNQIISSGGNFALGLALVRLLTPHEFGLYGIGFAISLFYAGIGNALFLTQMVVRIPDREMDERSYYASRIGMMVLVFCLLTGLLVVLIYRPAMLLESIQQYRTVIFATLVLSVTQLVKNFYIRYAYSIHNEFRAFWVSLGWLGGVLLVGALLLQLKLELTAVSALWCVTSGNIFAALVGFFINRLPVKGMKGEDVRHDFREAFSDGRWALGGVTVTWLQSQAYMYVTAMTLGPAGVAMANSARILISPFTFLLPAVNQIALPRLAAARYSNNHQLHRLGSRYTLALLLLGGGYILVILIAHEFLIPLMLGKRYSTDQIFPLVLIWCVVLLFQLARDSASNMLQALMAFRDLMLDNSLSAMIAVAATFTCASWWGIKGAILGTGAGELLLAILLWRRIRREHA